MPPRVDRARGRRHRNRQPADQPQLDDDLDHGSDWGQAAIAPTLPDVPAHVAPAFTQWGAAEVQQWLELQQLAELIPAFAALGTTGAQLLELTAATLCDVFGAGTDAAERVMCALETLELPAALLQSTSVVCRRHVRAM